MVRDRGGGRRSSRAAAVPLSRGLGLILVSKLVLGPRRSGLLTVFPVALTACFATLALGLEPLGIALVFALALAASLAAQVVVLTAVERRRDPLSWARGSR